MKFDSKNFREYINLCLLLGCAILVYTLAKEVEKEEPKVVDGDIYVSPERAEELGGRLGLRNYVSKKHEEARSRPIRSSGRARSQEWKRTVAIGDNDMLWDEGVIPYEISPNTSERLEKTIRTAIRRWESVTCLRFVPAANEHDYSIFFENEGECGCCSYIGKNYWEQELILSEDGCNMINIVLHEIGHSIGFHHEQNRPDRDKYIKVLYEHIEEEQTDQYQKLSEDDINTLGYGYDFDSIMHYASDFFSSGGETMAVINRTEISLKDRRRTLSKTDIEITNKLYKCPACLFNLREKRGRINFNTSVTKEKYCEWYIKREEGEVIEFVIDYVNIPENENCTSEYLDVLDGYWSSSPYIDFFCGNKTSETFYKTTSNHLLILFEIDENTKFAEFALKYKVACGGIIEEDKGTITSPRSPQDYPYSSECEWIIAVPEDHKVALHFKSFKIGDDCNSSYVEVWEGNGNDSTLLHTLCCSEVPQDVLSSGNTITVKYVSDVWEKGIGFEASFVKEINECETDNGGCSDVCVNTLGSYRCQCEEGKHLFPDHLHCEEYSNDCGGVLNVTENVIIASPSFPNEYPRNIECTWEILNQNVSISFLYLDLDEKKRGVCLDAVEINDFHNVTEISVCGSSLPDPINVTEAVDLKIEFKSNLLIQKTGFAILLAPL